jgi:hypothetical protein
MDETRDISDWSRRLPIDPPGHISAERDEMSVGTIDFERVENGDLVLLFDPTEAWMPQVRLDLPSDGAARLLWFLDDLLRQGPIPSEVIAAAEAERRRSDPELADRYERLDTELLIAEVRRHVSPPAKAPAIDIVERARRWRSLLCAAERHAVGRDWVLVGDIDGNQMDIDRLDTILTAHPESVPPARQCGLSIHRPVAGRLREVATILLDVADGHGGRCAVVSLEGGASIAAFDADDPGALVDEVARHLNIDAGRDDDLPRARPSA